jgi:hypothetical protein
MPYQEFEPIPSMQPGVADFVVRVPSSAIRGDKMPVPGVTTYREFPYQVRSRSSEAWTKDYVFVHDELAGGSNEPDNPALWEFYFTQNRGNDLFREPITFLTDNTTKPHPWDDVILRMGFIEDPTQPLTMEVGGEIVEVPRLFERYVQLPGGVYASKMKVEVFLSHEAFPEDFFLLDIPVPTLVTWNLRNASGRLKALHPHIRFKETQTGGRVLPEAGTIDKPLLLTGSQDFPATNHVQWMQHVCDEDVSQRRGVRRCVRTTVWPPGVKRIKNAA